MTKLDYSLAFIGCVLLVVSVFACGRAPAENNPTVIQIHAPDQSICYVIMQGATAVGGNCK